MCTRPVVGDSSRQQWDYPCGAVPVTGSDALSSPSPLCPLLALQANDGPLLLLSALLCATVWAAAAVVFISPAYVGIAVLALIKVLTVQFVIHVKHKSKVGLRARHSHPVCLASQCVFPLVVHCCSGRHPAMSWAVAQGRVQSSCAVALATAHFLRSCRSQVCRTNLQRCHCGCRPSLPTPSSFFTGRSSWTPPL